MIRDARLLTTGIGLMVVVIAVFTACAPSNPDLQIDQPYQVLLDNPVLRTAGGGILLKRIVGRPLLIGVGYAIIPNGKPLDSCGIQISKARFEAVVAAASADALLHVVSRDLTGYHSIVTIENKEERAKVIEETTRDLGIHFESIVKGLRPVGRWRGRIGDEDAVFVAMGTEFSPSHNDLPP